ncbi:hypothetical protein K402DRAFT_149918 [Aulographum hederae CBS 113979]|uniref:Uncharacterized protein n=1 Tax=Aulographum hederae CBS 113979 TaxID=1176131 RepID=A0A6G1GT19_9PEZI|nr:hypothetical protein K402DRAFT_149918 [Aulographum hederae CBS 113979]
MESPRQLVHVYGGLWLPAPSDDVEVAIYIELQLLRGDLERLEKREGPAHASSFDFHQEYDLKLGNRYRRLRIPAPPPDPPLRLNAEGAEEWDWKKSFLQFAEEEIESQRESGRLEKGKENHLVAPAGFVTAPISVHLNYPPYKTKLSLNHDILDDSNICIRMVLEKGFTRDTAFLFDQFARREQRDKDIYNPIDDYGSRTVGIHAAWTETIRRNISAKVETIWGAPNKQRAFSMLNLTPMPIWGPNSDAFYLEWTKAAPRTLLRILVFVLHPESFIYHVDCRLAKQQDQVLNMAAKLVNLVVNETSFENFAKPRTMNLRPRIDAATLSFFSGDGFSPAKYGPIRPVTPSTKRVHVEQTDPKKKGKITGYFTQPSKNGLSKVDVEATAVPTEISTIAIESFRSKPHVFSFDQGSPEAILLAESSGLAAWFAGTAILNEAQEFDSVPKSMIDWIQSQHATFHGLVAKTAEDVYAIYCRYFQATVEEIEESDLGLKRMILNLFSSVTKAKCGRRNYTTLGEFVVKRLDFSSVSLKCGTCDREFDPDTDPGFWSKDINRYVATRTNRCKSESCVGKWSWLIPQDAELPWMRARIEELDRDFAVGEAPTKTHEKLYPLGHPGLPKQLEIMCRRCQEKSTDSQPRFVKTQPVAYFSKEKFCASQSCRDTKLANLERAGKSVRATGKNGAQKKSDYGLSSKHVPADPTYPYLFSVDIEKTPIGGTRVRIGHNGEF